MISILTTNNTMIFRELRSPALQRVGVQHHVATGGEEAIEMARSIRPDVAILDTELPEMSGYDVCLRIKQDQELKSTKVVLVVEGAITSDIIRELSRSGCDEVMVNPAPGEELFHKVARLMGLPHRAKRRMAVRLQAEMKAGTKTVSGMVVDLTPDGARLHLDESVRDAENLKVNIVPKIGRAALVGADVVWEQATEDGQEVVCGVQFRKVDRTTRTILEDLALWDVQELEDGTLQVALQGDFREHTDFSRLGPRLKGVVQFDLGGVRYLNSTGVRRWVDLLRSLEAVRRYAFARCSVAFVAQASMVPEVLGKGLVESFYLPYACDGCDLEEERLLQTSALAVEASWPPELPSFSCSRCGGEMEFDDLPARYFAFLESDPSIRARKKNR